MMACVSWPPSSSQTTVHTGVKTVRYCLVSEGACVFEKVSPSCKANYVEYIPGSVRVIVCCSQTLVASSSRLCARFEQEALEALLFMHFRKFCSPRGMCIPRLEQLTEASCPQHGVLRACHESEPMFPARPAGLGFTLRSAENRTLRRVNELATQATQRSIWSEPINSASQ